MKKNILIFFILLTTFSFANQKSINLKIDSTDLTLNVPFEIEISLINMDSIDNMQIYNLENFEILNQRTSRQTSVVNGNKTKKMIYNYVVSPKKLGEFNFFVKVNDDGKSYKSNEYNLEVGKSKNKSNNSKRDILELETNLSDNTIYFGEKVVLSYNLYRRVNIQNSGFTENLNFTNFIVKDLKSDEMQKHYDTQGNLVAITENVSKKILKPTKTGELEIPGFNYQANVSSGDSFFSGTKAEYLRSDPKNINVQSLPGEKPQNFKGIVGKLNINTEYSNTNINYGDAITLKVEMFGNCNLDEVEKIIDQDMENFKVYETIKKDVETLKDGDYYAQKDIEIILVPKKVGELEFPEILIPYFNTDSLEYQNAKIKSFKVNVKREDVISNIQGNKNGNKDDRIEEIKISQINPSEELKKQYYVIKFKKELLNRIILGIFILISILILLVLVIKYRKKGINEYKSIFLRYKQAKTHEDYIDILNDMVKYKYNISIKANSMNKIKKEIENKDLDAIIEDVLKNKKKDIKELKVVLKDFFDKSKEK